MVRYKKDLLVFLTSFVVLMIISQFIIEPNLDSIWNYGFSYNMSLGKIPYRDFNMVISPFYNMLCVPFLSLFGNYLIVFYIFYNLLYSLVMVFINKKIGKNFFFVILLVPALPVTHSYNTFIAFLIVVILLVYDSNLKYKEELISLIIGLIIITKQNIGFILLITNFFITKNKIKNTSISIIPMLFLIVYLLINNALYEYIDFCYLGLSKFSDNFYYRKSTLLILILITILLLKEIKNTKDKKIIYLLSFLSMLFPLLDETHLIPTLIPILYYFLLVSHKNTQIIVKEILVLIFGCFILMSFPITLSKSDSFLFLVNVNKDTNNSLKEIGNYITNNSDKRIYTLGSSSYLIKIYLNLDIDFYDLINKGNLGKTPEKYLKKIDDTCNQKECLFIIDDQFNNTRPGNQLDKNFKKHIEKNYYYKEQLPNGDIVYTNKKQHK